MSVIENIYLLFAVICFTGFWLLLFATWIVVEVLPSPKKAAAEPDGERPAGSKRDRQAA